MDISLRFLLLPVLLSGVLCPAWAYPTITACSWLEFSPSTASNGMGTLASPYSSDPMVAWFLPGASVIGPGAAEGVTIEFSGHLPRTDWLPGKTYAGNALGHRAVRVRAPMNKALDQITRWVPGFHWRPSRQMSLSFSLMHQNMGYDPIPWSNENASVVGTAHPREWSTSARLGIGGHGQSWNIGAGLGFDYISSDFDTPVISGNRIVDRGNSGTAGTLDWGLVAERKLLDRVPLDIDAMQIPSSQLMLDLGVTGSWARNFVGGEFKYSSAEEGNPLPRRDRLALATRMRLVRGGSEMVRDFDLLRVHVAVEHSVTLVDKYLDRVQINGIPDTDPGGYATSLDSTDERDFYYYGLKYKQFEPDIFSDDEDNTRSWGTEITAFEMITVRKGRFEDHAFGFMEDTWGWGLDSKGLFSLIEKELPGSRSTPVLGWMLRNLRVRYDRADWESNNEFRNGTQFRQVTVDVAF